MNNLKYTPLGGLIESHDAKRKPVKGAERKAGPYPYYGASGIVDYVDGFLFDGDFLLVAEDGENLRTQQTPIAFMASGQFWVNNHAHIIRGNHRADTRFLMYAIRAADVRAYLSGSTMPKLTQANLNKIPIPELALDEQRRIVKILGTLDDKIELNIQLNVTLEQLARALFQSWFIDFDAVQAKANGEPAASICHRFGLTPELLALFPDALEDSTMGKIPTGWKVRTVGEIASVIDCLHAKKPERQVVGLPYLHLGNIASKGLLDMSDTYWISEADYTKWTSRLEAVEGDCVITNVGRVGAVAQIPPGIRGALGRNMTGIRCKPNFPFPTFLIEALLSDSMRHEIELKKDSGTILDALNVKSIPRLRFIGANCIDIYQAFEEISRPLRQQIECNAAESRTLAALRDELLPKLLSGDIRLN